MTRRTIRGGDGVDLGVGEYGDPEGRPVLLQHGLIGGAGLPPDWDRWAREAGVRLLAWERPGYGLTEPTPMSAVADWVPLLLPALDALGVRTYQALAISAGAPYAYALGALAPERCEGVGVLSGLPYVYDDAIRGHYPERSLRAWDLYGSAPQEEVAEQFAAAAPRFADAFRDSPWTLAALEEMGRHGHRGPAREARLQVGHWGFTPADVRCPVRLWHAPGDPDVPIAAARATASLFADAALTEQAEPTHLPSERSVRACLTVLAALRAH
ncbi:hypothetical protein GCM10023347_12790 [Streptomyces chumphonensis]|uniref:Alpha/beta hydrolase n=1 Tax=Streptomyces chumphonensis TaxID=1214925 RepID=A0A927F020_9ACTN|nr:alpha/beta hydrolase [Streptomyces chumphonensis]MBD3932633.1 alpha/beta hydrolase [Streptomyces chumphonensis]